MSVQRKVATIPASGIYSLATRSNFLLFVSATGAVNLRLERSGSPETFDGVTGGLLVKRISAWEETRVIGAPGVQIEALIGDELVTEDETDVRLQIATIAGVAAVAVQPAVSLVSTLKAALATGNSLDVSANLTRKRITICNESASLGSVWFRDQSAVTDAGVELQPGQSQQVDGTYAFRVRNNSGASANISFNEES